MKSALFAMMLLVLSSGAFAQETKTETSAASAETTSTGVSPEPEANKENSSYVICRNQKLVRTIRVDLQGAACKAVYTKEGKDDIVGKSGTADLCYDVVRKIRINLEKGGAWKCKDVQPDRVSFTAE